MGRDHSGFTVLEVIVTAVLLTVLVGAAFGAISSGRGASSTTVSQIDIDERLRKTLKELADELRWAGRQGEDLNGNRSLDDGEDENGNGRLDADWSVGPGSLTFNMLTSKRIFGLPITYRLQGSTLEKVAMTDVSGRTATFTLARNVTDFTVEDVDGSVKIRLTIGTGSDANHAVSRTESISITPRN